MPASWNESSSNKPPSTCSSSSATGTYASATNTAWPTASCTATPTAVPVRFNEIVSTSVGDNVSVVGSIAALGSWNVSAALLLSADQYSDVTPLWHGTVSLPTKTNFEYKYVLRQESGDESWESGPNRPFTVPDGCQGSSVIVNDQWK